MEWFLKNRIWLTAAGLAVISGIVHFLAVNQTEHPTGFDGYYYVMQVHSYLTYGHLQSPDSSLVYPFLILLSGVAGDPILGFKIGVTLISVALVLSVFFVLQLRGLPLVVASLACAYLIFSPTVTFFLNQFPKNALGMVFLIWLVSVIEQRRVAALFLFLALFTHRMSGALAILTIGISSLRDVSWKWIVAGAAAVVAVSLLPGMLHASDLARFEGQFIPTPQWAPWTFSQLYPKAMNFWWVIDLVFLTVISPIIIVLAFLRIKSTPFVVWVWVAILAFCLITFFVFEAGSLGFRLFLIIPIAVVLSIPAYTRAPQMPGAVAFAAIVLCSCFSWKAYNPTLLDPPNGRYEVVANKLAAEYSVSRYPLVIVHKSLAEVIIFETDFDALNWLPPDNILPTRTLRIVTGIEMFSLKQHLSADDFSQIKLLMRGYQVMPEDVWIRFIAHVRKKGDKKLMKWIETSRNPMAKRPEFINKGRAR